MKKYRHAVSALVLRPLHESYEILLVHKPRKNDAWQLPQGGLEEGEDDMQAAVRELQEETGLTELKPIHMSDTTYTYDFPPEFLRRHNPVNSGQTLSFASFLLNAQQDVKVDDREIDAFRWVLPEKIRDYIKREEYVLLIEKVLAEATEKLSLVNG